MICKYLDLIFVMKQKRKFSIFIAVIIRYNPHHFIGDLWTNLHLVRFMKLCCQFILKHQNTIFKTHLSNRWDISIFIRRSGCQTCLEMGDGGSSIFVVFSVKIASSCLSLFSRLGAFFFKQIISPTRKYMGIVIVFLNFLHLFPDSLSCSIFFSTLCKFKCFT